MSIENLLTTWLDNRNTADSFCQTVRALASDTKECTVTFYGSNLDKLRAELINVEGHRFQALCQEIIASENQLSCSGIPFSLSWGQSIGLEARLIGSKHRSGTSMRVSGRYFVIWDAEDFAAPDYHVLPRDYEVSVDYADESLELQERPHPVLQFDFTDLRRLVTLMVGAQKAPAVQHLAMQSGGGWVMPMGWSVAYHREVAEFGRDYYRMFANIHWETEITDTFEATALKHVGKVRSRLTRDNLFFDNYVEDDESQILEFAGSLTWERVQRLMATPDETMRELIHRVAAEQFNTEVVDFGSDGMVLMVPPLSLLWKAYWRIADWAAP